MGVMDHPAKTDKTAVPCSNIEEFGSRTVHMQLLPQTRENEGQRWAGGRMTVQAACDKWTSQFSLWN